MEDYGIKPIHVATTIARIMTDDLGYQEEPFVATRDNDGVISIHDPDGDMIFEGETKSELWGGYSDWQSEHNIESTIFKDV